MPEFDLIKFEEVANSPPDSYEACNLSDMAKLAVNEIRRLRQELCRYGAHPKMTSPELVWEKPHHDIKSV